MHKVGRKRSPQCSLTVHPHALTHTVVTIHSMVAACRAQPIGHTRGWLPVWSNIAGCPHVVTATTDGRLAELQTEESVLRFADALDVRGIREKSLKAALQTSAAALSAAPRSKGRSSVRSYRFCLLFRSLLSASPC
jgi:hypothetical protein